MTAPGRYCLNTCYCGGCPHWQGFTLTATERNRLLEYLSHPPRKYTPSWYREPLGQSRFTSMAPEGAKHVHSPHSRDRAQTDVRGPNRC